MRALILNSGMGTRMGSLTDEQPKCMTEIAHGETILSRQLKMLKQVGITKVVITVGFLSDVLRDYCGSLDLGLDYVFVENRKYDRTNYIFSIYLAREHLKCKVLMLHGDLVFEQSVLRELISTHGSSMTISTTLPLPPKDFKAMVTDGMIRKVGVELLENAYAAQPLYKLELSDWVHWLNSIVSYCENGQVTCYAEDALNEVTDCCRITALDVRHRLCNEIDNIADLEFVRERLDELSDEEEWD